MSAYGLAELQGIDERCREIAVTQLGFDVPDVVYHVAIVLVLIWGLVVTKRAGGAPSI